MKLGAYSLSFERFSFKYQTMALFDKPIWFFCKNILTPKNIQGRCSFKGPKTREEPDQVTRLLMSLSKVSVRVGEVKGIMRVRSETKIKEPKSRWHMSPWLLPTHPIRQRFIFILVWSVQQDQSPQVLTKKKDCRSVFNSKHPTLNI